ncbi:MAG: GHMP family kinase ATP-binding protein [Candidatus Hodarchaeales archaeon]
MEESRFWVASHVTGFFEIVDNADPVQRGSRGAGFNLERGSITRIKRSSRSSTSVFINNEAITLDKARVTASAIDLFEETTGMTTPPLVINHDLDIPISAGYGASAAGALGTVFCLNDLFATELSRDKLFEIAHVSETKNWCGLGDISGLYQNSGTEIRKKPGAPEKGKTTSFDINSNAGVFTCSLGSLKTAEVLHHPEYRQKIIEKGRAAIERLIDRPDLTTFMDNCREFSDFVQLYSSEARGIIKAFENENIELPASIMIGDGLFILTEDSETLNSLRSGKYPFNLFREEKLAKTTLRRID